MTNHFTADAYAFYVLGHVDPDEQADVREHLEQHCETCVAESSEANELWFVIGALTERMQFAREFEDPAPNLRERVINIGRVRKTSRSISGMRWFPRERIRTFLMW